MGITPNLVYYRVYNQAKNSTAKGEKEYLLPVGHVYRAFYLAGYSTRTIKRHLNDWGAMKLITLEDDGWAMFPKDVAFPEEVVNYGKKIDL